MKQGIEIFQRVAFLTHSIFGWLRIVDGLVLENSFCLGLFYISDL
jgi:hypothetical protein